MQNRPLVSIITPSYNYGHYIEAMISSLVCQTYENWECIVVDDGSTDHTRSVMESLMQAHPRVRYCHQPNSGVSIARNLGVSLAEGDFIMFLDADDMVTANKIFSHVAHLEANPHVGLSYSGANYFADGHENFLFNTMRLSSVDWIPRFSGQGYPLFQLLINSNMFPISSPVIRADAIGSIKLFDAKLRGVEDWDFFLRLALSGCFFEYLDDASCIALIRVHQASATNNTWHMDYGACFVRHSVSEYIKKITILSHENQSKLIRLNSKKSAKAARRLLLNHGFNNKTLPVLLAFFPKRIFFTAILKAFIRKLSMVIFKSPSRKLT